ncbi:MAG: hypothetical protein GTO46_16635 [Gemmatimonadetes bacterium]|nr:hypothetical protein [Gemmatimonadota bacterium]NIO33336.1 hypothetical protein [Gemmatimonadota bacterium]
MSSAAPPAPPRLSSSDGRTADAGLLAVFFFELPFLAVGLVTLLAAGIIFRYVPETVSRTPLAD